MHTRKYSEYQYYSQKMKILPTFLYICFLIVCLTSTQPLHVGFFVSDITERLNAFRRRPPSSPESKKLVEHKINTPTSDTAHRSNIQYWLIPTPSDTDHWTNIPEWRGPSHLNTDHWKCIPVWRRPIPSDTYHGQTSQIVADQHPQTQIIGNAFQFGADPYPQTQVMDKHPRSAQTNTIKHRSFDIHSRLADQHP